MGDRSSEDLEVQTIIARAEHLGRIGAASVATEGWGVADAELLAALLERRISIADINDEVLGRWDQTVGMDRIAQAIASHVPGARMAGAGDQPPRATDLPQRTLLLRYRSRVAWGGAVAACLVIGLMVTWWRAHQPRGVPENLSVAWSQLTFKDNGAVLFNAPAALPHDLDLSEAGMAPTMGSSSAPAHLTDWELCCVVVDGSDGFGSGVFVAKGGWVLTAYDVVAADLQRAAVTGVQPSFKVFMCDPSGSSIRARSTPVNGIVYRADPVKDLALLKLNLTPEGSDAMRLLPLASQFHAGDACFVIGSPRNAPPWSARSGTVTTTFEFPSGLSGSGGWPSAARPVAKVIASSCPVSGGDPGGPLITPEGELQGLSFDPAGSSSAGSAGYHISFDEIRAFVREMPSAAEAVPFDLWTAGRPWSRLLRPRLLKAPGPISAAALDFAMAGPTTGDESNLLPEAIAVYVKAGADAAPTALSESSRPLGLWGLNAGTFNFDFCLVIRNDGLRAIGYADDTGQVSEIRIGQRTSSRCLHVWTRDARGLWHTRAGGQDESMEAGRLLDLSVRHAVMSILDQISQRPANGK